MTLQLYCLLKVLRLLRIVRTCWGLKGVLNVLKMIYNQILK